MRLSKMKKWLCYNLTCSDYMPSFRAERTPGFRRHGYTVGRLRDGLRNIIEVRMLKMEDYSIAYNIGIYIDRHI